MQPILALDGVSKSFAGVHALKNVSFDVRPGEVHALMGENGAGKSTLIKVMAGVHAPDSGDIRVNGEKVRFASPREARAAGIATVYQELLLFPELSVAENIFLGHAPRTTMNALDWTKMRNEARRLLDDLDSHDLDVDARVGSLSVANRQRVEIAQALSQDARVLIMDEPTAALADADARRLMDVVRRLRDRGVAIVYVSHRMPEIFALATRVTVLRDGAYVGTHDIGDITEAELVSMMAIATRSRTPRSPCAPARSSASPVWSARVGASWRSPSSASRRPPPARSCSTASPSPSPARNRPATAASPMCRKTAACRA